MYRTRPGQRLDAVVARLTGALIRAFLVILVIATPALMLPGTGHDTTQIVALVALFAGALTFVEYASVYPGLIEFRDAPPFNRLRLISLFLTLFSLSALVAGQYQSSPLIQFVQAIGGAVAQSIDFPYSPVRLLVLVLPEGQSAAQVTLLRSAAGVAYIISLITLGYFVIVLRMMGWPHPRGGFNVWVNLPTFDPTAGGDVVARLRRDARVNIALGFVLPFLIPAALKLTAHDFAPVSLESAQSMIWMVTAWAFLPASLFMRGIAMGRVAAMIAHKRQLAMPRSATAFA